ncbi:MAG: hypothetical protein OXR73_11320, partial [Myxococcales bacterium]|nr:hypothetical protein [Myxococcales bacterium]
RLGGERKVWQIGIGIGSCVLWRGCLLVWLVGTALLLGACAHDAAARYGTRVEAFVDPEFDPQGAESFCFFPPDEAHPDGGLPVRSRYDELARVCAQVALDKGLELRPRACLPMRLDWGVAEPADHTKFVYNAVSYAADDRQRYRKTLRVSVFSPSGASVAQASAWMLSRNPAFTDRSAEVLCRAIFHQFPARLDHKRYTIRIRDDRPVPYLSTGQGYRAPPQQGE